MTIGEVAERTGINASAIRYYERAGLLPEPELPFLNRLLCPVWPIILVHKD